MKRLFQLLVVICVLALPLGATAKQNKVDVCHARGNGDFHLISIAEAALEAHLSHGDGAPGDAVPNMEGYVFDEACRVVQSETPEVLLAVAYTDIDPSDGGYNPDVDVLISKLVDTNNDGVVSVGDTVEMGQYPKSFNPSVPTDFGSFAVTSHTLDSVSIAGSTYIVAGSGTEQYAFSRNANGEQYFEVGVGATELLDIRADTNYDRILTNLGGSSPSQPDATIALSRRLPETLTDDAYFDVDILVP